MIPHKNLIMIINMVTTFLFLKFLREIHFLFSFELSLLEASLLIKENMHVLNHLINTNDHYFM